MTIKGTDLLLSHVKATGGMTGDDGTRIEVKDASHQYSDVKYAAKHAKSGEPIMVGGEELHTSSQREQALLGVWFKQFVAREMARSGDASFDLTEHERDLLRELYAKHGFRRLVHAETTDEREEYVKGAAVKALIDDGTSGGQELVPEYFDNALVQYPLLHSEVLPYVDIKDVPRGSSVETAAVGNPTVTWNQAEASAIGLFDTTGLVSEIAASIYSVMVAIEIGLDLMGDTPANIGQMVEENIGQRMMAEFDKVITSGDSTTQPQGIDLASATTDVTAANPTTGAVTVTDLMNLLFAVGKQYRTAAYRPRFVMTDTTYKRFRSVATGVTGDSRFHLGDNVNSYNLLGWPVSIDNSGLTNSQAIFGAMSKYRFWRRRAPIVKRSMVGDTNLRRNSMTIVVRGRVGGKVVDGNAFSICDSLPA